MYLQCRPSFVLAPYIETLWYCEGYQGKHRRERVLPNGRFQLIIDLAAQSMPALLIGMRTGYDILETARLQSVMGVLFRPGGARPFFDTPADALYNQAVPLDSIWGSGCARLRDRLLESASPSGRLGILNAELQRRLDQIELHPAVQYALGVFSRDPHARGVIEIAQDAGLSRRRFAGLFREQVGLPPKVYCRLRRFQQVVRRVASGAPVDWAEVALAGGYYDQAHMAHEFREFSGVSPGAWAASDRPFQNHAILD
jgi:AraC-like DNA-binding protein